MRRRSTYVTDARNAVNPDDIQVSHDQILLGAIKAAREERLTLGLKELPKEITEILEQSHDLHIRWAPEKAYDVTAPFLSRLSPGLHIHYTPLNESQPDQLCTLIHKVFGDKLKCDSPRTTFVAPLVLSSRFTRTSKLQYYSSLPSIQGLVSYLQRTICTYSDLSCLHSASLLTIADSIDIDYDSISHALILTVFWSKQPEVSYDPIGEFTTLDAWNIDVRSNGAERVEVGILSAAPAQDPSELSMSGFLTVVGEDDRPKATLFSFPSRHHQLSSSSSTPSAADQTYTVHFDQPTGLHPILRITFPSASSLVEPANKPPDSVCALQAYLTLPSHIFIDKWAFLSNDPLFQQSHHLGELHSLAGDVDLEAPDYVVQQWGSTALFSILTPTSSNNNSVSAEPWHVTIPTHLRYLTPQPGGVTDIDIPWPLVFWACTAEQGTKFPVNPFDRTHLGYEGLFGPRTMFYHLRPTPTPGNENGNGNGNGNNEAGKLVETISLPVLDTQAMTPATIEIVTVVTILLGFGYVLWMLRPGLFEQWKNFAGGSAKKEDVVQKKKAQ